ncbi:MAG: hypothetical protein KGK01_10160 [Bradyrhizobium sp.]|uniref:hypothetical protein n=1 Tax=Bradyrhizobium sp. TaxID=376 RepID=UPI00239C4A2D|nr:hypothetical protein [Bradyrhizobium sp.]MDE2242781.1 hypothetical protein [Bradyrhizobium sp.]MDE2470336.1 hypothetical protein [Bradyrhizobium sp.]
MTEGRPQYLKKARLCREHAAANPVRRKDWLLIAEEWTSKHPAKDGDRGVATHEVHDGRLIPKPAKP